MTAKDKMMLNLDGEYGGLAPAEFVNLYRHFDVFVPQSFRPDALPQKDIENE